MQCKIAATGHPIFDLRSGSMGVIAVDNKLVWLVTTHVALIKRVIIIDKKSLYRRLSFLRFKHFLNRKNAFCAQSLAQIMQRIDSLPPACLIELAGVIIDYSPRAAG
jgi:hypothetical protein